ncbi:MAG: aldehyde dehydrogenase (NADP(+)) [Acidobacteriales bacterium]|nr:aldehyde dehydrogenase (NADP(+)) [Terriglobales bacterium]
MNEIKGTSLIGYQRGALGGTAFRAFDPSRGESIAPDFHSASLAELDRAARIAESAFHTTSRFSGKTKAVFLRKIAANLEWLADGFVSRIAQEAALPEARIRAELGRTCFQHRMFADLVEEGSWVAARLDRGDPQRQPQPKPALRSMLRPLGPVAVFCAGNFPLAYSVAGGDTASAFAAGCPVIVNAHYAHPGAAELAGNAIIEAARSCGMPEGTFSLLFSAGQEIGQALVQHPSIKAVGFTGSRRGGTALMRLAGARPEPIPFYAEMSSVNPIFFLPGALRERGDAIAAGLHSSVTQGVGQFCTNPGLLFAARNPETNALAEKLKGLMSQTPAAVMLTPGIHQAYQSATGARVNSEGVRTLAQVTPTGSGCQAGAALFATDAETFLKRRELAEEVFGPETLLITHNDRTQLLALAESLEGQLTATVHATESDLAEHADLLAILERKAGRIVFNGYPTGVEVGHAIVHGGPFPATSDGRTTSVGTRAVERFTRLVCWQNAPEAQLPEELQAANPLGIWRQLDGRLTRDPLS